MRKYQKANCLNLLKTIDEAVSEIIDSLNNNQQEISKSLLVECQNASIQIGNSIEKLEGEGTYAVSCLEEFCEKLYQIHEEISSKGSVNNKQVEKLLKKHIAKIKNEITFGISTQIEAVFFPYKASMWDSLESIWMAANEDPNCTAYVVPIPYFDRNPDGSFKQVHYEGEKYPDYVPITRFDTFDLEKHHPDLIFIHNPYDQYNYVTSVHPTYYSFNLRKFTDCLVYVPYYATSGKMSEAQALCPSYDVVDYIVVQNQDIIEQFDKNVPREKFLPLGSPKFDRVIRLCNNPPEPSKEWQQKMAGKRVYFYNTSINAMLNNTEKWLKKLRYVFDTFKETSDACLLWRPHPLLRSTFESMCTEDLPEYDALVKYFIEENIGIYDDTPDIEQSIAFSDAYIGDSGTSVISLFQMVNKPVYLLNYDMLENPIEDWWKGRFFIFRSPDPRQSRYAVLANNKLFYSPDNDGNYKYLCDLPGGNKYGCYAGRLEIDNRNYIFPTNAQDILVIEDNKIIDTIKLKKIGESFGSFSHIWIIGEYVFIIPKKYPHLVRFNIQTNQIDYVKDISSYFWRKEDKTFCGHMLDRKRGALYFMDSNATEALRVDVKTLETSSYHIGYGKRLSACTSQNVYDTRYVWFLPIEGKNIARWDFDEEKYIEYCLDIDGLVSKNPNKENETCDENYFGSIIPISDAETIFCPKWANIFVKLNTSTGSICEWIPPFTIYTEPVNNYFNNWGRGNSDRSQLSDVIRWVNAPERMSYDLDIENNRAIPVHSNIAKDDIYKQYAFGFETKDNFYRLYESWWNPLKSIISGNISGENFDADKARILSKELSANTTGTAGLEIYKRVSKE